MPSFHDLPEGHDALTLLVRDHRDLRAATARLIGAAPRERRRALDSLTFHVISHVVAEELHLHPALRRHLPDGAERAGERGRADAAVERTLGELREAGDGAFEALARRLLGEFDRHVRDEERALFPRLAASTGPDELRRLGERLASALDPASIRPDVSARARPRLMRILARRPAGGAYTVGPDARPRTTADPGHQGRRMWPDLWAQHRCWPAGR